MISISILFLVCGCATLFSRKTDDIKIDSEPQGAKVYVGAQLLGTTPLTYTFHRSLQNKDFTVIKDGYESAEVTLRKTLNTTSLWNIGFITTTSGVTSWGIDALSGALIEYSPNSYIVPLKKTSSDKEEDAQKEASTAASVAYFVLNKPALENDIARGSGTHLEALYRMSCGSHCSDFAGFRKKILPYRAVLVRRENGVELYREMKLLGLI